MEVFVAMKSEVVQERKEELGRKKIGYLLKHLNKLKTLK